MVRWLFVTGALPILIACSSPEEMGQEIATAQGESVEATLQRRVAAGSEPTEFSDNETRGEAQRDFAYGWPAQISAIAPLAAILEQSRDDALTSQKTEWEQSVAEFGDMGCITCINRSYSKSWKVDADTSRFLIVHGETYTYTGGAHGNSDFDALAWDREGNDGAGEVMDPVNLFVDPVALENVAYGDYCQSLLEERARKFDQPIEGMNKFENCPSVAELVVVPLSSDGKTFDRINFLAAPYVAGSFAEGPYEFAIPMTQTLLTIVRPKFRDAFSVPE